MKNYRSYLGTMAKPGCLLRRSNSNLGKASERSHRKRKHSEVASMCLRCDLQIVILLQSTPSRSRNAPAGSSRYLDSEAGRLRKHVCREIHGMCSTTTASRC